MMKCIVCGKELTGRQERFCSKKCNNKYYRKNNEEYFKEYKNNWESENMVRLKEKKEEYAKEHGFESLNKLTYLHQKIREEKPKPDFCPICDEYKKLQLASINHTYTENPNDYIWLCQSCHYIFDKFNSGEKEQYDVKSPRRGSMPLDERGSVGSSPTADSKPDKLKENDHKNKEFYSSFQCPICKAKIPRELEIECSTCHSEIFIGDLHDENPDKPDYPEEYNPTKERFEWKKGQLFLKPAEPVNTIYSQKEVDGLIGEFVNKLEKEQIQLLKRKEICQDNYENLKYDEQHQIHAQCWSDKVNIYSVILGEIIGLKKEYEVRINE